MKGSMKERSPGHWFLRVSAGQDPATGKYRYVSKSFEGGKREAQRELAALVSKVDRGEVERAGRLTLGAYLKDWLSARETAVSAKTQERQKQLAYGHVIPRIGATSLKKLTHLDISTFYASLLKDGNKRREGGLHPQTIIHIHRMLSKALKEALRDNLITRNPATFANLPKVEKKTPAVLTPDDKGKLLAAFDGHRLEAAVILLLTTGLRRGEVLGLTWDMVDLKGGTVTITRSIQEVGKTIIVKEPKNRTSARTIMIPSDTVEALKTLKKAQSEERVLFGWGRAEYVVTSTRTGGIMRPSNFTSLIKRTAKTKGLNAAVHILRHSHLTDLMAANVHPKIAQTRAGHSRISTTLDLYSHALPEMQGTACDVAEGIMQDAERRKNKILSGEG